VQGGTLRVNGSFASGRVTVAGGTLGGTGTIAGPVTIGSGGTLAPGNGAVGTLTINNVLTNAGVTLIEVSKTGSTLTNDSVKGVSTLALGGTLSVTNTGSGVLTVGDSFKIFSATTYRGAFTAVAPATPGTGLLWSTNNLYVNGTLAVALGTVQPQITQVNLSGANLVMSGSGGAAGYHYSVLSATNLAPLPAGWSLVGAGDFDGFGGFTFTNQIDPQAPQQFYEIRIP
jgi:hypothetical protein